MAARAHSTGRAALRTLEAGDIARPFPPIPNLRAWLDARCEHLSDELQRLIALLDTLDGDCDLEEGGDTETSLGGLAVRASDGRVIDDAEYDKSDHEWSLGWRDKLCQSVLTDGFEQDLEAGRVANLATYAEVAL